MNKALVSQMFSGVTRDFKRMKDRFSCAREPYLQELRPYFEGIQKSLEGVRELLRHDYVDIAGEALDDASSRVKVLRLRADAFVLERDIFQVENEKRKDRAIVLWSCFQVEKELHRIQTLLNDSRKTKEAEKRLIEVQYTIERLTENKYK